jgi:hypothetical protein
MSVRKPAARLDFGLYGLRRLQCSTTLFSRRNLISKHRSYPADGLYRFSEAQLAIFSYRQSFNQLQDPTFGHRELAICNSYFWLWVRRVRIRTVPNRERPSEQVCRLMSGPVVGARFRAA